MSIPGITEGPLRLTQNMAPIAAPRQMQRAMGTGDAFTMARRPPSAPSLPRLAPARRRAGDDTRDAGALHRKNNWVEALHEAFPDNVLTPLQKAMVHNDTAAVQKLLAEKANIEECDSAGHTALHIAAVLNSEKFVELLLERGARVNASDHRGLTPAFLAARFRAFGTLDLLLDETRSQPTPTTAWRSLERLGLALVALREYHQGGPADDDAVDAMVRLVTGAEDRELKRASKLKALLLYHAHLLSLTGRPLGMDLEGWHEDTMLVQRIRTLLRIAVHPNPLPAGIAPTVVGELLLRSLQCDVEQLRLMNRLNVLERMDASPRRAALLREEARHVTTLILGWPEGSEFSIPTGFAEHSAYVACSRRTVAGQPVITLRLDNLGATQRAAQFTDKTGHVAPLSFNLPLAFLHSPGGSHALLRTVESLLLAHVDPSDDHVLNSCLYTLLRQLKRTYPATLVDTTPFSDAAYRHKPQSVGNCVLKNHSAGLCARLGRPLFKWYKQREVADLEARLGKLLAPETLRNCEEEKWHHQWTSLLQGKTVDVQALRTFLNKPGRTAVLKRMDAKQWRALIKTDDLNLFRSLFAWGATLPKISPGHATPLHWAIEAASEDITKELLEHGANVHATDEHGATPLHLAVNAGDTTLTNLLLSYGADATLQDSDGLSPRDIARDEVRKAARLQRVLVRAKPKSSPQTPPKCP